MVAVSAGVVLVLAGCAKVDIGSPRDWPKVSLRDAEVMPKISEDFTTRRTRVVVFPPSESRVLPGVQLPGSATSALEQLLASGGIEVIDRKDAGKLDEELKRAEMAGVTTESQIDVADYALTVQLGNATYGSEFVQAKQCPPDKKTGRVKTVPASYTHVAKSDMTVRVIELPSLRLAHSVAVKGAVSVSQQQRPHMPGQAVSMLQQATSLGVTNAKDEVLNALTPRGYVIERRAKPKDDASIFRVMLGKDTGAKTGDEVEIYTLESTENPLTKKSGFDQVLVGKGRLSNVVGGGESWVIVDDKKAADRVRRGDVVKVKHDEGFLGMVSRNINIGEALKAMTECV